MALLNWTEEKGNPFDYKISEYKDTISNDTEWKIAEKPEKQVKPLYEIRFNNHLKTVSTFSIEQAHEVQGIVGGKLFKWVEKGLDVNKPVTVWLDYPFEKKVLATIYPLVRTFDSGETRIMDSIGYYVWQIAQLYADIYKNHWESVGICCHGFNDLYLESITVYAGNELRLYIGS